MKVEPQTNYIAHLMQPYNPVAPLLGWITPPGMIKNVEITCIHMYVH